MKVLYFDLDGTLLHLSAPKIKTFLAGGAFERCRTGLPEWFDENIDTYCLDALNDGSYAAFGTADGRVYGSDDGGLRWLELITGLPSVQHLLLVPD